MNDDAAGSAGYEVEENAHNDMMMTTMMTIIQRKVKMKKVKIKT